jgi:peptidoglycan hydrolase CwlO-like protein
MKNTQEQLKAVGEQIGFLLNTINILTESVTALYSKHESTTEDITSLKQNIGTVKSFILEFMDNHSRTRFNESNLIDENTNF